MKYKQVNQEGIRVEYLKEIIKGLALAIALMGMGILLLTACLGYIAVKQIPNDLESCQPNQMYCRR